MRIKSLLSRAVETMLAPFTPEPLPTFTLGAIARLQVEGWDRACEESRQAAIKAQKPHKVGKVVKARKPRKSRKVIKAEQAA